MRFPHYDFRMGCDPPIHLRRRGFLPKQNPPEKHKNIIYMYGLLKNYGPLHMGIKVLLPKNNNVDNNKGPSPYMIFPRAHV